MKNMKREAETYRRKKQRKTETVDDSQQEGITFRRDFGNLLNFPHDSIPERVYKQYEP
jgi:hypothetical protein